MGGAALKRFDVRLYRAAQEVQKRGTWSALLAGGGSIRSVMAHASSFPQMPGQHAGDYETVSVHSEPVAGGACVGQEGKGGRGSVFGLCVCLGLRLRHAGLGAGAARAGGQPAR